MWRADRPGRDDHLARGDTTITIWPCERHSGRSATLDLDSTDGCERPDLEVRPRAHRRRQIHERRAPADAVVLVEWQRPRTHRVGRVVVADGAVSRRHAG